MVVTVNLNSRAKILALSLAATLVLMVGIGIFVARGGKSAKSHGQYTSQQEIERLQFPERQGGECGGVNFHIHVYFPP